MMCSQAIERWFAAEARDLPWRSNRTPWRSLVSEFMLQQTQVARVLERFEPFLERFPAAKDLAVADVQEVLSMWQGLGYYRRARNLRLAAQTIVDDFGGEVPLDVDALRRLPGVGRYTAGSMASIVGGQPVAAVDGNVTRLLARVYCDDAMQQDPAFVRRIWSRAEALVDACGSPPLLNEGMMELGARVCSPASPSCGVCPLEALCGAHAAGRAAEIPPAKGRPDRGVLHQHTVVIRRRGSILLERRPEEGLWGGLWQTPAIEGGGELSVGELVEGLDFRVEGLKRVSRLTRQLTHRTIHIYVHAATVARGARVPQIDGRQWVRQVDLPCLPLSSAARAVLEISAPPMG
jgi:A/G-specific adenine glycosylase